MTLQETCERAIIYDELWNFVGIRIMYKDKENANMYVFIGGWAERVSDLTAKGYKIASETITNVPSRGG